MPVLIECVRCHDRDRRSVGFNSAIETSHVLAIETAAELRERGDRRGIPLCET
jgi:hypothetical protein